jgi:hypothetical protein
MAKVGNANAKIAATVIARSIRHLSSLRFFQQIRGQVIKPAALCKLPIGVCFRDASFA